MGRPEANRHRALGEGEMHLWLSAARPTLEAYWVDVFTTARKFGYPIEVLKNTSRETNRYGLLLVE